VNEGQETPRSIRSAALFLAVAQRLLSFHHAMTAITIRNLSKRFGNTVAVDDVTLTIKSGELFFLLGPSGCGKTTLLRMIAGFIEPTAGRISFGDRDVTSVPPNARNTGMVFQSYALWPHMTVEENVAYGLNVRHTPGAEKSKRVLEGLKLVHMEEYAKRKPNQLSGGQQQRVALARALVIRPTVLLLDEPLSNLDAKLRTEMRSEIRRICTEVRITTVYVTHDQKEALSMADTMAVLRSGKVVQLGEPRQVYEKPTSRFVADFLGETNFIPAVVGSIQNGTVQLETAAGVLQSTAVDASTPPGGNVTCSVRPEAIRLISPAELDANAENVVRGKRVRTIYLGEMAQHHIDVGHHFTLRALELNPRNDHGRLQNDHEVALRIDADDIVILND
jgi:iron(III) transport system ATP-binding protein